jgi:hypothetical protein
MGILKILGDLFRSIPPKCDACNERNADAFGLCEPCLTEQMREAAKEKARMDHFKLKCAVREVMYEIERDKNA